MSEKGASRSDPSRETSSNEVFHDFQHRILNWMNENYGRILDVFRRFDSDNSGRLSYEEFADGMRVLGAPASQVEIYITAMALDADGDKELDYREFKKLRKRFMFGTIGSDHERLRRTAEQEVEDEPPAMALDADGDKQLDFHESKKIRKRFRQGNDPDRLRKTAKQEVDDEPPAQLQPCPNCSVGLWEPAVENISGYVMLDLRSISFQNVGAMPGQISAQVPSNITIYGISLIVKRELGPCTLNIRIYQPNETGEKEEMEANIKLMDMGFTGTFPPNEPESVTLFYDYDCPLLDCPLLMANFSI